MDLPPHRSRDILAHPLRAELFRTLGEMCRAASTHELADAVGRHPNTVRAQLQRLAAAGLLERRTVRQARGRPYDEWVIAVDAAPGGRPPEAHAQVSRWLARAIGGPGDLASIEATGREIGRELGATANGRPLAESMTDALAALGFVPRREGELRFVLRNCPYRDAVLQNPPAICSLHRGVMAGLLERLDPRARLTEFVPRDPRAAGCIVELGRTP